MDQKQSEREKELGAAEDLRRQLQERSGIGPSIQSREEIQEWLNSNGNFLSELADKMLGEANYDGIVESANKEIAETELISPYDEPLTRTIVRQLCEEVETACHELGIPLRSGVAFGSTPSLTTEAARHSVFFTEASVITFSLGGQLKTGQLGSLQNRPTVWPRT